MACLSNSIDSLLFRCTFAHYHILSILQKVPPPKVLRSDSRSLWTSNSFFGFIIPDKMELNFFFFFLCFLALMGTCFKVWVLDLRAGTTSLVVSGFGSGWLAAVVVEASDLFAGVVFSVVGLAGTIVAVAASCGETAVVVGKVLEGEALVVVLALVVVVASEGRGAAFGGGAASAESMAVSISNAMTRSGCLEGWNLVQYLAATVGTSKVPKVGVREKVRN